MKLQTFLVITLVLSIVLVGLSWGMSSRIEDKECTNVTLKKTLRGLLMMSMFILMITISIFINLWGQLSNDTNTTYMLVFMALLGLAIIILASIIAASTTSDEECNNFTDILIPTIIIGCIIFIFSVRKIMSGINEAKKTKENLFAFKKRSYY